MKIVLYCLLILCTVSCAVKRTITHEYGLQSYTILKRCERPKGTLLVSSPEALAGFTTEEMRYMVKPYELRSFAENAWYSPPADMLLPLMVKSLQQSGLFTAVTSSNRSDPTDYRIDTQLIDLRQNFLTCPSLLDFTAKVVLTHVSDNRIIASHLFEYHIVCKEKTPFGGVVAANEATKRFTAELTDFIMHHLVN